MQEDSFFYVAIIYTRVPIGDGAFSHVGDSFGLVSIRNKLPYSYVLRIGDTY